MKSIHRIAHLLIPRESNNHKARVLHPSSLGVLALFLIILQLVLNILPKVGSRVLGYAANISVGEVVALTNQKRAEAGLAPLGVNSTLSQAALAKGTDMLNKGYWAHVAPDGSQPWKFFTDFGYKYHYAAENLARDFSSAPSAVDAWMASPTHRENMLSSKYKEIGIGVVEGSLAGVDTTIIVQFFGAPYVDTVPAIPVAKAVEVTPVPATVSSSYIAAEAPSLSKPEVTVSPFATTKNISFAIVAILLMVLIIDSIITSRKNIVRIGGRTFAHISFFGMILAIIIILKAGQII
ncbi:CAP domain-containing protein [Patescibacteria group bacterium]